jgi:hypothetical protein
MSEAYIEPGRCYYAKRVGWRWQVWFCRSDESADPASGATEWMATSTRFWRWITAARIANEMWSAFNDGVWIADCRHADAACSAARARMKEPPREVAIVPNSVEAKSEVGG